MPGRRLRSLQTCVQPASVREGVPGLPTHRGCYDTQVSCPQVAPVPEPLCIRLGPRGQGPRSRRPRQRLPVSAGYAPGPGSKQGSPRYGLYVSLVYFPLRDRAWGTVTVVELAFLRWEMG